MKPGLRGFKCSQTYGALAVVACLITLADQAKAGEPESRGRPLSYWLASYMTNNIGNGRQTAETAIREMGSNALPALLVWLRYEPSQSKVEVMEFLKRMRRSAYGRWIPPN